VPPYEAVKVLECAGVLTWQHRITRIRERCQDLFGRPNRLRRRALARLGAAIAAKDGIEQGVG
jgi:hypothetical protein